MVDFVVVATAFVVIAIAVYFWQQKSTAKLPNGPTGWPIVGNLDFFLSPGPQRHFKFLETGRKYGGIFRFRIGILNSACVTSYRLFREATVEKGWSFADRPHDIRFPELDTGILTSGVDDVSKAIRRFTVVSLRSFGFGKTDMQNIILNEADLLVEEFQRTNGSPFNPRNALTTATANIMSALLIGKRFDHEEAGFSFISEKMSQALKLVNTTMLVSAFPWLRLWPHKDYRVCLGNFRDTKTFIRGLIK
ncbi:cytochrome P450 2J6-like [Paramacrobiotus metropolitanus]|uniref:cytochrome P450 2J6-like n=1 Tax=Paramacrobiotus metropolitanus TaxID=2943436 RepID=UPI00244613DB|nr:cytochrome P450 2J6-like [Paramacrobiotus metropolitanus]